MPPESSNVAAQDVTKTFCAKNGINMVVRSHQSKKDGIGSKLVGLSGFFRSLVVLVAGVEWVSTCFDSPFHNLRSKARCFVCLRLLTDRQTRAQTSEAFGAPGSPPLPTWAGAALLQKPGVCTPTSP